jgi:hypothetical protein
MPADARLDGPRFIRQHVALVLKGLARPASSRKAAA